MNFTNTPDWLINLTFVSMILVLIVFLIVMILLIRHIKKENRLLTESLQQQDGKGGEDA